MSTSERATTPDGMRDLARRFAPALRRFFQRRITQANEIDDLVQEVFLRLVRRGGVDDVENMEGYVFLTASNILRDRYRQRSFRRSDFDEPLDENYVQDSAFSPERVLLGKEVLQRMLSALEELPETTQDAFILCYVEGHTHEEVAEDLGMTARSVRNHVKRALEHLIARRQEEW